MNIITNTDKKTNKFVFLTSWTSDDVTRCNGELKILPCYIESGIFHVNMLLETFSNMNVELQMQVLYIQVHHR